MIGWWIFLSFSIHVHNVYLLTNAYTFLLLSERITWESSLTWNPLKQINSIVLKQINSIVISCFLMILGMYLYISLSVQWLAYTFQYLHLSKRENKWEKSLKFKSRWASSLRSFHDLLYFNICTDWFQRIHICYLLMTC